MLSSLFSDSCGCTGTVVGADEREVDADCCESNLRASSTCSSIVKLSFSLSLSKFYWNPHASFVLAPTLNYNTVTMVGSKFTTYTYY